MNEAQQAIEKHLKMILDLKKSQCHKPEGYAYYGNEDFLLQHGRWFAILPFPCRQVTQGAVKACFGNALMRSVLYGYRYIEGYAMAPKIGLPIHHAWNADKDWNLIDSTWMNTGLAYYGVEFSAGRADNATWFDNSTVLDNPFDRWSLYKEPWQGENFNRVWRKSKAFKTLLRLRS